VSGKRLWRSALNQRPPAAAERPPESAIVAGAKSPYNERHRAMTISCTLKSSAAGYRISP
jgi:hypothetical protein